MITELALIVALMVALCLVLVGLVVRDLAGGAVVPAALGRSGAPGLRRLERSNYAGEFAC
ncbi:MAG: hypothetical protein Q7R32_04080 [Dehalococcoidia bacterium]|nr:hypothetical protein [Dehalococcoidia bacterium]